MHIVISNPATPTLREFASWAFEASGNYAADNARGRGLARQFVEQSDYEGFATVLPHLVASIAKRGDELTGLEIGFLTHLSRHITAVGDAPRPPLTLCSA